MPIKIDSTRLTSQVPDLSTALGASSQVLQSAAGAFRVERLRLQGGRRDGVEVVLVDTGRVRAAIVPTRGMSLWRANIDGLDCGWTSPIAGPVHPQWVAMSESGGLGWLDGFDELLVRCGLRSFGAPDFDPQTSRLAYPLHGHIGNLPADHWELELDADHSLLHVRGTVNESRFLQHNLQLRACYTFAIDSPTIEIRDSVTNASDLPASIQLLYHINVGQPLLSQGAMMHVGASRIVARDAHAADGLDSWATYAAPTPGYVEQVYFSSPTPDADGKALAVLAAADGERGFAVHYETKNLPHFSQWKNTVGVSDGYVTGLEPGTGYPNPRSFEQAKGRVIQLDSHQTLDFNLMLEGV